jgi:hypothetical protein
MSAWAVVRTTTALAARQQGRRAAADRGRRVAAGRRRRGEAAEDHVWFEDRQMVASWCDE